MKKDLYIKIDLDNHKPTKTLINVCAWCPKEGYPRLKATEDYTHGLCEKHYLELRRLREASH